jgi:hypothetical protein
MSTSNGNGRDDFGRFAKGNAIAAGNPMNLRMRELRRSLLDCATEADIRDIYNSLMESARGGDTAAARVLLEYLVGKPPQALELSGPDGSALGAGAILSVVTTALKDFPEARVRVAAEFKRMAAIEGASPDDEPVG